MIQFRCSPDEKERWRSEADRWCVDLSDWIRSSLERTLCQDEPCVEGPAPGLQVIAPDESLVVLLRLVESHGMLLSQLVNTLSNPLVYMEARKDA